MGEEGVESGSINGINRYRCTNSTRMMTGEVCLVIGIVPEIGSAHMNSIRQVSETSGQPTLEQAKERWRLVDSPVQHVVRCDELDVSWPMPMSFVQDEQSWGCSSSHRVLYPHHLLQPRVGVGGVGGGEAGLHA